MEVLYAVLIVVNTFALIIAGWAGGFSFVNPNVIHKNVKVNWFGAYILAIVFHIILPLPSLTYWIYKICTVGR